jgi:hypothetical protein
MLEDSTERLAVGLLELVLLPCVDCAGVGGRRPDAVAIGDKDALDEAVLDEQEDSELGTCVKLVRAELVCVRVYLHETFPVR